MTSSMSAPRTWLRTCSPRSATASDASRIASERASSAASPVADDPNRLGNIVRQPTGSTVSPFITARARRRWTGVASASSVAVRRTWGSAWMPA